MNRTIAALALSAALLAAPFAEAAVPVSAADPSRFTDADRAGGLMTPAAATASLARLLEVLGRRLPAGTDLAIRIDDIDLAGRIAPERALSPATRVLDGSTWPRVRLSYRLVVNGRAVAAREELVDRKDYLQRPVGRFSGDPLRYEKAMLAEWFEARFGGR